MSRSFHTAHAAFAGGWQSAVNVPQVFSLWTLQFDEKSAARFDFSKRQVNLCRPAVESGLILDFRIPVEIIHNAERLIAMLFGEVPSFLTINSNLVSVKVSSIGN